LNSIYRKSSFSESQGATFGYVARRHSLGLYLFGILKLKSKPFLWP